jgi:hypothetical protein
VYKSLAHVQTRVRVRHSFTARHEQNPSPPGSPSQPLWITPWPKGKKHDLIATHFQRPGTTERGTLWDSSGPREPGQVFYVTSDTTFRWMATDIKGNVSFGIKEYRIGTP